MSELQDIRSAIVAVLKALEDQNYSTYTLDSLLFITRSAAQHLNFHRFPFVSQEAHRYEVSDRASKHSMTSSLSRTPCRV